uniref:Peptidase S1 domain-containing protein n=1 Tax=Glossina brevipalpis TaxID=37001 RepID=A0A1A9WSD8_9MUSC
MLYNMTRILKVIVLLATVIVCANAVPSGRIVGGVDAEEGQFKHQISLQHSNGAHTCGGSILNERYVLTAAHCVMVGDEVRPPSSLQIRAGSVDYSEGGKLLEIKRILVNENYGNFVHDLALLELKEPLEFCDKIQPIELATKEVPSGGDIIVSGWGRLYNNGPIPNQLQWTTLKAMSTDECRPYLWELDVEALICLAHGSDHGVCNGDSGGPATYKDKLVGVASFVMDGCGSKNPDGYAKVSSHYEWIMENMKN